MTSLVTNSSENASGRVNIFTVHTENEFYNIHVPSKALVDMYATPLIYLVGFPGNVLSFLIWVKRRMRKSSGCYLAALAMADLLFLSLHIVFELNNVWNHPLLDMPVVCELFPVIFLGSQYLSPLLVLAFTVERYISICHPFQREKLCTTRRAVRVVISLYVLAFSLCAIQGYFWTYNSETDACEIRDEVSAAGTKSLWSIWTWITEMLIFLVVPLMVLILNAFVIKEARRLSREEEARLHGKQRKTSATTVTLLAVSFYLIITTLPVTIMYAIYFSFVPGNTLLTDQEISRDPIWQSHLTYMFIRAVIQEIGTTHYACNFFIYLITGKMFREELKGLLSKLLCKPLADKTLLEYRSLNTCVGRSEKAVRVTIRKGGAEKQEQAHL
ncbi:probable G-protein coupled receptor 139 [Liolophura sinensis]|uniref:probable G-protein coupled receptor 139 n=1 Tax=Liolophura sinensis TaxID=3198878 RepID=UPI003157F96E